MAPGGHCFHQKTSRLSASGPSRGVGLGGARAQSLVSGPSGQDPCPRCPHRRCLGRPVAEAKAPRLASCWRTGRPSWWTGLSPGPGRQQTPIMGNSPSLGRACPSDWTPGQEVAAHGEPHLQGKEAWIE